MQQTADVDANQILAGTPVSGSFSCFCAAADVAMDSETTDVDAAITDADANLPLNAKLPGDLPGSF